MSLSRLIERAVSGNRLDPSELEAGFGEIMDGLASPVKAAALLVALRMRGETRTEIVAAARAMRARAEGAVSPEPDAIDTCGTGGSPLDTFNISTTSAFVVAGAGVPVAKHGNRAASSRSGSFDVLEALGVRIDLPIAVCAQILGDVGIAPLFARTAHPAMRHLAPVRSELGFRTLMNCLGPLLNPLGVSRQLVGVYSADLLEPLGEALGELGAERALVVHGRDGLDEVTLTDVTDAVRLEGGRLTRLVIDPREWGLELARPEELAGGTPQENAQRLKAVLEGVPGPGRDVVVLNAAAAIWTAGQAEGLEDGIARATQSLESGAARAKLDALIVATAERAESLPA